MVLIVILTFNFNSVAVADINLTFGTYAVEKPTETVRKFKPFLDHLSKEMTKILNEPVYIQIKIASEYSRGISDLTQGNVDFSRFRPASYVTAKGQNPDIRIIAVETKQGKKIFKGIIAIHAESDLKTLGDLRGRTFAFGDQLSTIGRYLAQAQLLDAGISGEDLKVFAYLGRHDRVGAAVGNQDYDAGALKESTFKKLIAKTSPLKNWYHLIMSPTMDCSSSVSTRIYDALNMAILNKAA